MKTLILNRPVIAVAGSSGKTTTKEMIASILKRRWKVFKSAQNKNNRRHLAQHRKKIKSFHRAVVLEFGMSARGHLRRSCKIIQPNMVIITMIGTAHIGNVGGSIKALTNAKSGIILNMKQTGKLFISADNANSKRLKTSKFKGEIIRVGIKNEAAYQGKNVRYTSRGMAFSVNLRGINHDFFIPIFGEHNVYNALFAIAVADRLGFNIQHIKQGLESFNKPPGRLRVYNKKNGVKVIDDTFNANPNSVKAAIDVLSNIGQGKNIAVLGNMSELGKYSKRGHKEVGRHLAKKNVTNLCTYGKKAKLIGIEAVSKGFPANRVKHSRSRKRLHRRLKVAISPSSTILVKGSHDQKMNKTVRFLKAL